MRVLGLNCVGFLKLTVVLCGKELARLGSDIGDPFWLFRARL